MSLTAVKVTVYGCMSFFLKKYSDLDLTVIVVINYGVTYDNLFTG